LTPTRRTALSFSVKIRLLLLLLVFVTLRAFAGLPFDTVFKGQDRFQMLVERAQEENWKALPIGERTCAVGRALVGTPYRSFTLEIDDHIEAPSVNLNGFDCWTFFETSLAFARMLNEPRDGWTPQTLLHFIELDRYRGGHCTGQYLSRLHYLEDWLYDNDRRGLVRNMTRSLGGIPVPHEANEMTHGWHEYRYLRNNPSLLGPLGEMEERVAAMTLYEIPKSRVPAIESKLQDGDVIGIVSRENGEYSTAHVGMAYRDGMGNLHFMHASSPNNYGRVVIDDRISNYLSRYRSDAGIIVGRPLM
jgi:cell wall-associated NlpC family hydrolase